LALWPDVIHDIKEIYHAKETNITHTKKKYTHKPLIEEPSTPKPIIRV